MPSLTSRMFDRLFEPVWRAGILVDDRASGRSGDPVQAVAWRDVQSNNLEIIMRSLIAFLKDDSGTETLEWGLVCGLLVVGAITAIGFIGPKITDMWNDVNNSVPNAD